MPDASKAPAIFCRWQRPVWVAAAFLIGVAAQAAGRKELFAVPDFNQLPPRVEIVSSKTQNGVVLQEVFFDGAPFNGQPTRIHGFYARPAGSAKYPAVVQLHGAGLEVLTTDAALFYAKNGFACLSIDWAGPGKERKTPRTPPFSTFTSPGNMAVEVGEGNPWRTYGPEQDGITNGVRFVRRSFLFLRSRPEVDANKLFLSGTSAGAHLSLLVLGVEPGIKAATLKYGTAFIKDLPGYFGGYFGPLTLAPQDEQDAWLAVLDPKHGIPDYKARVLLLSGTDDIFFWMPVVLHTYRQIPSPKDLLMLPNDNHSQVTNEEVALRYYQAALGMKPALPKPSDPTVTMEGKGLRLQTKITASSPPVKVDFVVKRMPVETFRYDEDKETGVKWELLPAQKKGDVWSVSIPAAQPGEQVVAYVLAEDGTGARASSDTVEIPAYPKWRGK
ncbi:MAG: Acetyl xylan esterase (AXE1)/PhoPQ-activated pathogenicity-related protein [Rariglobus sp.]|jgi:dienelactone hydrolase|nr:Acetyl xylan esterase (AXE1)/PhoPQ-activated pathogenicity-related protein [Rariglobus sp.]